MPARQSSRNNGWLKSVAVLVVSAGLGGCADYLARSDTVTLGAGDAQNWNKVVHTADPWPPYVMDTRIAGDGQRTARAIQRYSAGNAEAAAAAPEAAPTGEPAQ